MLSELTCPKCASPVAAPAPDEPAICPQCGCSVTAASKEQIQPGLPDPAPAPSQAVQHRLPRRAATPRDDWGADEDVDIRVPARPIELRSRTTVAVTLIALVLVAELAGGAAEFYRFTLIRQVQVAQGPRFIGVPAVPPDLQTRLEGADNLCMVLGGAQSVLFLISAIVYLMWIYRAYANLRELHAAGLNHTPGWAVGMYFVPLVNLVRGYTVMQEIWKGSDPQMAANDFQWKQAAGSALVAFWWLLFLGRNVGNSIGGNLIQIATRHPSLETFAVGEEFLMAASALALISGLLLIRILIAVTRRQEERSGALYDTGAPA